MKRKKHVYISIMLATVFLLLSISPIATADTQLAHSKISPDLLDAFSQRSGDSKIDVIVLLTDDATEKYQEAAITSPSNLAKEGSIVNFNDIINSNLSSTKVSLEERLKRIEEKQAEIMENRRIAREIYLEHNTAIAKQLPKSENITYISRYSPLLICNLSKEEAFNIARDNKVSYLMRGDVEGEDNMSIAYTNTGTNVLHTAGYYGQGIKIGMLESSYPNTVHTTTFNGVQSKIKFPVDDPYPTSPHATLVAGIMTNQVNGTAKGFEELHCRTCETNAEMVQRLEELLNEGVNVINMSWGIQNSTSTNNTVTAANILPNDYGFFSKWIDHISYNHSVHIVIASGNYGRNNVKNNAMAYNAVVVGAVDDKNLVGNYAQHKYWETLDSNNIGIIEKSAYNDIPGLPYKPDLCAYGVNIQVDGTDANTGTSFASPQVAGIIASLCSLEPELLTLMDLTKAVLTCSTLKEQHNYNTDSNNYRKYGAGIVNASNAMELLNSGSYISGHISSTENRDTYSLGVLEGGVPVTISLSFLKRTKFTNSDHDGNLPSTPIPSPDIDTPLPDLDIYIVPRVQINVMSFDKSDYTDPNDYTYIFRSISVDNNTEKITFTPGKTEYILVINKAASSDYHDILYGVAWLKHTSDIH